MKKSDLYQNLLRIVSCVAVIAVISTLLWQVKVSAGEHARKSNTIESGNFSETPTNSNLLDKRAVEISDSPVFAEFDAWIKQYSKGNPVSDAKQMQAGDNLVVKRQALLKELIQIDPKAALEHSISTEEYNRLPLFITKNLERRFSAYGDFLVYILDEGNPLTGEMTGSRTEREVVFGSDRYNAVVYGRREAMTSKLNIPLQGIILGDTAVIDESPLQKIKPADYAWQNIDSAQIGEGGSAAEIGGKIAYFSDERQLNDYVREQIEWESKIGPERPSQSLAPEEMASPWTEGQKSVLVIRVDFSDRPGEPRDSNNQPLTEARALNLINNEVNQFYVNGSYGKTSLQATVTSVVRLPQPLAFYTQDTNYTAMLADARNAARTAGFETNNFNLDIVAFTYVSSFTWGGRGSVGYKGSWLNGTLNIGVVAHELGHNFGLNHANSWLTTDRTTDGQGSGVEYGDVFDIMGNCYNTQCHFNTRYKRILDWLTDANVQNVTSDGVYRILAQDSPAPGGIRALSIRKDSTKKYWVEFRQLITTNSSVMSGATVRWDPVINSFLKTQLLDMTPNNQSFTDSPLLIGQSFSDNVNRIKITVLGKGNTTPESLDVRVELNVGCTFSVSETTQNFTADGGEGSVDVTAPSGCVSPATANSNWLHIISSDDGTGTVRYIAEANYSSQPRTGTLNISGQTVTVQQAGSVSVCLAAPSGLVSWWRGEGNALDETGVNNGVLTKEMPFGGGKIGGGFKGSGGQSVMEVSNSNSLALTRSLTFEGWVRFTGQAGSIIYRGINSGNYSYHIGVNSSGQLAFWVGSASTGLAGSTSGSSLLQLNQFAHFTVTLDDATGDMKVYINGSKVGNTFRTAFRPPDYPASANAKVYIGGMPGITDELSAYNRALTDLEIKAIYNAGMASTGATGKCLLRSNSNARSGFDFDGDGKADISVFRPSNGAWYLQQSANGFTGMQFGLSSDKIVPADYDGDGKTDVAVYRSGTWYLQRSRDGFTGVSFGDVNDIPVPADYDGDGKADLAVFRPSNGTWYLLRSGSGFTGIQFGQTGDKPVAADYDGDGKTDVAVFRDGTWYLQRSQLGFTGISFGESTDKPIPADFDGDGKADVAVFRPSNGTWYLQRSQLGFTGIQFGLGTDLPTPADYDGDGKTDVAVFRDGTWYLQRSTAGFTGVAFGDANDKPIPTMFVP